MGRISVPCRILSGLDSRVRWNDDWCGNGIQVGKLFRTRFYAVASPLRSCFTVGTLGWISGRWVLLPKSNLFVHHAFQADAPGEVHDELIPVGSQDDSFDRMGFAVVKLDHSLEGLAIVKTR